jgi:hypothetical protein
MFPFFPTLFVQLFALNGMPELPKLTPPIDRGKITVVDVHKAKDAQKHAELVRQWGISVWEAWKAYHQWARRALNIIKI